MKKTFPLLLVALVFGIGGFFVGTINAVKSADITALMWITSIHQFLEKGKYEQAMKICFDAANIHLHVLQQMEEHPLRTCTSFLCGSSQGGTNKSMMGS